MTVRINIRRLLRSLITSLIAPMVLAVFIDMQIGWFPLITIGATVIFIPLSTIVVVRAALAEMEQLIQKVAPPPTEVDDAVYESSAIGQL